MDLINQRILKVTLLKVFRDFDHFHSKILVTILYILFQFFLFTFEIRLIFCTDITDLKVLCIIMPPSTTLVRGGRWCTTRMASASARTKNLLSHDSSTSVEGFRTRKREVTDLRGRKANTYSLEAFLIQRSLERSSDDADFFENGETFFVI